MTLHEHYRRQALAVVAFLHNRTLSAVDAGEYLAEIEAETQRLLAEHWRAS